MPEINELVEQLAEHKPDEVAKAINESLSPVFQVIFNKGFSQSNKEKKTAAEQLQARIDELEKSVTDRDEVIQQLQEKQPDVKAVETKYQEAIAAEQEKAASREQELADTVAKMRRDNALATLKAKLNGLNEAYVDVIAEREMKRVEFDEKGEMQVMQRENGIPFAPSGGKQPLDLLAEEIRSEANPIFVLSSADRGSGASGSGGSSSGLTDAELAERKRSSGNYAI